MNSSVLGNLYRSNIRPGSRSAAVASVSAGMLGSNAIASIASWQPLINVGACVERPIPPAERPAVENPGPTPVPAERDPEIILSRESRERPGITSKTRSVGKKLTLVDHRSFYGFDSRAGGASIPWSDGMDPIRFLTGRLWTTYPPLHLVGETADLFGKTVKFGNTPPGLDRLNDPEGTTDWIMPIDFSRSKLESESLEGAYKQIMLQGATAPVFADLVEVGKVGIEGGSIFLTNEEFTDEAAAAESDPGVNRPTFLKFLFGNGDNPRGRFIQGGSFGPYFADTPMVADGLFTAISNQQLTQGMYSDYSFEYSMPISSVNLEHYGSINNPNMSSKCSC